MSFSEVEPEPLLEFTFFVDAETYMSYGGELDATDHDLHDPGSLIRPLGAIAYRWVSYRGAHSGSHHTQG